jgi:ABC-type Mn2+/Zn2+ transport system permease subunit
LGAAYWKDIPAGPAIVLAAVAIFAVSTVSTKVVEAVRSQR